MSNAEAPSAYIDRNLRSVSNQQVGRRGGPRPEYNPLVPNVGIPSEVARLYPITDPEKAGTIAPTVMKAMQAAAMTTKDNPFLETPAEVPTTVAPPLVPVEAPPPEIEIPSDPEPDPNALAELTEEPIVEETTVDESEEEGEEEADENP